MNKIDKAFELIDLFHDHNHESYLVGGSVRDLLMERPIKDIDITTDATPSQIISIATKNNLKYIENGITHGTITIIYKDIPMEVTTFRVDKDCDGRHCEVEFVKSLEEDLSRRDFTINAIAIYINGDLIDMFNGIMDIKNKIIKAVGNPLTRFEEDKLRALRAVRFATTLNFDIEQHTYNAIKFVDLESISKERVRDELTKILLSNNRTNGIRILDKTGLLSQILPEVEMLKGIDQDEIHHPEKDVFIHTMIALEIISDNINVSLELVLSILLHDIGKPLTRSFVSDTEIHFYEHEKYGAEIAESILRRLKFSLYTIEKVKWLVANHMRVHHFNEMKKSKKVKLIEHEYFNDLIELLIADISGSYGMNATSADFKIVFDINDFVKEYNIEKENRPALQQKFINGYDVMNLGVSAKEGIKIGQILEKVNEAVIEGIVNTKEEALKYAGSLI